MIDFLADLELWKVCYAPSSDCAHSLSVHAEYCKWGRVSHTIHLQKMHLLISSNSRDDYLLMLKHSTNVCI